MEYCKKCGAKIDVSTGCCINCGLHVKDYSKKKSNIGLKIILVIILVLAILLGVKVVLNMIEAKTDVAQDDGYLKVVEDIVNAVYVEGDVEAFVDFMADSVVDSMIEENFDGDEAAFQARMQEVYADMESMTADAGTVTWDINEEIDIVGAQLNLYEAQLEEEMGVDMKIRSAKALDLTVSYEQNGEAKKESMYVIIGIIDGEWCLISFS